MMCMNMLQGTFKGVYLGLPSKSEIIKIDFYKDRQNYNAIVLAEVGRGMSFSHKTTLTPELNIHYE